MPIHDSLTRCPSHQCLARLWLLAVGLLGGCAQFPATGGLARQPFTSPAVANAQPARPQARASARPLPVAPANSRSSRRVPVRATSTAESFSPPLTPAQPPAAVDSPPATGFAESPDGFWIVSSRQARGAPSTPDSSRQLGYLYRSPRGLVPVPRETFLSTLRPDRPVCVVIHGSYNYWPDVISESLRNYRWITQAAEGHPVQFVYFTWPSDGYAHIVFPAELYVMGRRSAIHSVYLANLISQFPPDQPVTLIGHSHGARAAVGALHALGGGAVDDGSALPAGSPVPRRVRSVLVAAAVDHDWLNPGHRYGKALEPVERMLVIHNHRDGWLSVYPLKNVFSPPQALGRTAFNMNDRMQLDQLGRKITLVDSSNIVGRSHDFSAFNSRPEFAAAISPFVTFQDAAGPPLEGSPVQLPPGSDQFVPPLTSPVTSQGRPAAPRSPRGRMGTAANSHDNAAVRPGSDETRPRLSTPAMKSPRAEIWVEPEESE
ncbi:MAG: alpha/beta hydrolase [Planctomycetaceae bacterium]|nr:MAG: alpha/beta hydrolase [Planctomycetaceae bacterium]